MALSAYSLGWHREYTILFLCSVALALCLNRVGKVDLSDLPQFAVMEILDGPTESENILVGLFSHLRGVRNERGWLYRDGAVSLLGDLRCVPADSTEPALFLTPDMGMALELKPGSTYPWLDRYWDPRHVAMVLASKESWSRRSFSATPARYFRMDGVTGWQPVALPLPQGAEDLGIREGAWDHEHCELCNATIGASGAAEGFVNLDDYWLCVECHARYAVPHDLSFALEP
jgi:hypothetical protein